MDDIYLPEPHKKKVMIDGVFYEATAYLSAEDMIIISKVDTETDGFSYRKTALKVLLNHLIDFPYEEVGDESISDKELKHYIDFYVENSDDLKNSYDQINSNDFTVRFISSLIIQTKEISARIKESFKTVYQRMTPLIEAYKKMMQSSFMVMIRQFEDSKDRLFPNYSEITKNLSKIIRNYADLFRKTVIPEDKQQELVEAFKQWGRFCWTLPPNAKLSLFFIKPDNKEEAYKIIKPFVNKRGMNDLFDRLYSMNHLRKSDLKEAIDNYNDKRYKSCIMLLFSMLDARIIRLQTIDDKQKRSSGFFGVDHYFTKLENDELFEFAFADALHKNCIVSSFEVLFEKGNDFHKQPSECNRNFVDHGMLHRKVTQKDCKKTFLLLYNFTAFIDEVCCNR